MYFKASDVGHSLPQYGWISFLSISSYAFNANPALKFFSRLTLGQYEENQFIGFPSPVTLLSTIF